MMKQKIDDQTIQELKAKHKNLYLLTDEDGDEYVCKGPTVPEVERFLQDGGDKKGERLEAFRGLAMTCVVYPDGEKMAAIADEFPFIVVTLGNKLSELAKLHENIRVKKL